MDLSMNHLAMFSREFTISSSKRTGKTGRLCSMDDGGDDDGCELMLGLRSYHGDELSSIGQEASYPPPPQQVPNMGDDDADPTKLSLGLPSELEDPAATASSGRGGGDDGRSTSAKLSTSIGRPRKRRGRESPEASAATAEYRSVELASDPAAAAATRKIPRKCSSEGCGKGARGATGLCIAHGGGQRCHRPGCHRGAESRTAFCKAHGGGRRCQQLGCTKSAEGRTDLCIAHGGGRRCGHPAGCAKAARGSSGLCIRHGGGKRCSVEGCARSAEGLLGRCISHGGGRRCQHHGCAKGAQGSTMYCKAHGGGRRCAREGCTKGAEGSTALCKAHGGGKRCLHGGGCAKSVHGGTDYCVAHGGGKRCAAPGCTKSARGRTACCVRHGGGRRCRVEGCAKSAQGSTDLCKAHGGGRRCAWPRGCEKFARGRSGLCAAHASAAAREREGCALHAQHTASTASTSMHQCTLPASSMHAISHGGGAASCEVPEGRVHGGGLMSLLGGSFRISMDPDLALRDSDSCA